jgi:hypothetical protein
LNAKHTLLALIASVSATLGSSAVLASKIPGDMVTGTLTAANGQAVTVSGHVYPIQAGSPATAAAAHVTPGQVVDVQLNGPASSSASQVVNITPHVGR